MSAEPKREARAFAPATVANVAVGFDILGFPLAGVGDEVTVAVSEEKAVRVDQISGIADVPSDAAKNVASVALTRMVRDLELPHGFSIAIKKGIPLASGMGGSAASAVAAVVAANELLKTKLSREELFHYALIGEEAASGAIHGDNVGPCLYGGLTLVLPTKPLRCVPLQVPKSLHCLVVHPDVRVHTKEARGILKREVPLQAHVEQSARLAGFISACASGDLELLRESMKDTLIEPQRAQLIPGFADLKADALALGAIGFAISGSGPSVFCWTEKKTVAELIREALFRIFAKRGVSSQAWISPVASPGAKVVS